jgi:di/tricarboxylate transporter
LQEAIELPVVIMIAAAFGIAEAMVESGAATILAKALMGLAGTSMVKMYTHGVSGLTLAM